MFFDLHPICRVKSRREIPNPNLQIPGKSQSPNSKSCKATDFTDHADMEELYSNISAIRVIHGHAPWDLPPRQRPWPKII
jgi:hypothetical protein